MKRTSATHSNNNKKRVPKTIVDGVFCVAQHKNQPCACVACRRDDMLKQFYAVIASNHYTLPFVVNGAMVEKLEVRAAKSLEEGPGEEEQGVVTTWFDLAGLIKALGIKSGQGVRKRLLELQQNGALIVADYYHKAEPKRGKNAMPRFWVEDTSFEQWLSTFACDWGKEDQKASLLTYLRSAGEPDLNDMEVQ